MAVIVRNDRGKVLGLISKVGAYIDLRGVKQRMTPTEAHKFAVELVAFVGGFEDVRSVAGYLPTTEESLKIGAGPTCEVCGKQFKDGRGMAGHARTHTGQELGVA